MFARTSRMVAITPLPQLTKEWKQPRAGGADGIRTHDLDGANVALSQLSYGPGTRAGPAGGRRGFLGMVEPRGVEPPTSRVRF